MLRKFAVTGFRGFASRLAWDLTAESTLYDFHSEAIHDGVVKNGIVFGVNGSGKTNLSLAVFDLVYHLTQKCKRADYFVNYVYGGNPNGTVSFEYEFLLQGKTLRYNYTKNVQGKFISEELYVDDAEVFKASKKAVHIPEFPQVDQGQTEALRRMYGEFSLVNYLLASLPLPIDHYLLALRTFAEGMLWFRSLDDPFIGLTAVGGINLYDYIIKNKLIDDFANFLQQVSGQTFTFPPQEAHDNVVLCQIDGMKLSFGSIISAGTRQLALLYFWLQEIKKKNATFVFIDEFDAFYHFRLSQEVCHQLFLLPIQVFLTSHNTFLISNELLRPDCYYILQNNQITSLNNSTTKEIREEHNLEKLFRGGTFSL